MDQKEAVSVSDTVRAARSSGASSKPPARRQFAVRKTMCESVSTKTIVMRLAVSRPIWMPIAWVRSKVAAHAVMQLVIAPATIPRFL